MTEFCSIPRKEVEKMKGSLDVLGKAKKVAHLSESMRHTYDLMTQSFHESLSEILTTYSKKAH